MRAKFIKENLEFERGKDPKKAMGIGPDKLIQEFSLKSLEEKDLIGGAIYWPAMELLGAKDVYEDGPQITYMIAEYNEENNQFLWGSLKGFEKSKIFAEELRPYRRKKDEPSADNYSVAAIYKTPLGKLIKIYRNAGIYLGDSEYAKNLRIWEDWINPKSYK